MGYKLVIAEKPMLGRDIARAMCGRKVSETTPLPISGNGYTVVACAGHLLELVEPEHVDRKWGEPWSIDALPILIPDWPKQPAKGKDDLVERIRGLLDGADCVIHAGDPDDEGQLIVDELLDYLGYKGEVLRVYVNDNIEKNIQKAFERLVPNGECRNAGRAAYARQMADACFGMNETRLATKRLGGRFTVGRVQTPTLGLVVNRDEEIEHHVSRKYYELTAMGGCADAQEPVTFKFKPGKTLLDGETRLFDREPLDALKDRLDGTDTGFTTVLSEKVENPPLPYNLTVLLSDMSRRYGFTAAKTQQITQDLRDKYKAITYNRSDSQYLKEEHHAQAPTVLAQAMRNLGVSWELDHTLTGISCTVTEKETTPPKPYTEGTLIADMASIAKYVKDPETKTILKRKDDGKKGEHGGIGTTATRAEIIEKLKQRGFLDETGGKVRSTEKARAFYRLLPPEIRGADVTARWWLIQQDIADGRANVNSLQDNVVNVFRQHMDTAYQGAHIASGSHSVVGKCPLCGQDVVKTGSIYACSSNRNEKQEDGTWKQISGCGFKLFGFCGKKLSEKQASALLSGKQVPLKGCKSKAGKTFDCKIRLKKDGDLEPTFDSKPKGKYNKARR